MTSLAIILALTQAFTGAFHGAEQPLLNLFNIFNIENSPATFTRNLNSLIGPIKNPSAPELVLNARASLILDLDSDRVLYSHRANDRLPMASITKIMTALVVLDEYDGDRLDEIVTVPVEAIKVTGSKMYLVGGEKLTARNLLSGMLITSANDAALAWAHIIGGTQADFVAKMNAKAETMGLSSTHFTNPIGFDAPGHYSTATDLAKLTRAALNHSVFAQIVSTAELEVTDTTGRIKHNIVTTNRLLDEFTNVTGVKTGTTTEAGESLVVSVKGGSNQQVVVVLLDSPDRFTEGRKALDWALTAYSWIESL